MKKILCLFIVSILAHYLPTFFGISTLSAQVPTTPGSYQWVKGFGSAFQPSTTDERISFSKLDNEGNLIISGIVAGFPHFPALGGKKDSIISNHWQQASKNTGFLAKYDCDGNLLWLRMLNDSINGTGIGDFVIDSANNIYAAMYCTFGTTNLYWNDSLFCQFSWTPTMVSEFILVKVDKNGHMKWIWGEPYHASGNSLGYGAVTQVNSGSPMANAMVLSNDTISYFTYFGNTYGIALNGKPVHTGMNILDFSIKTGALLNHTNITDTLGFWVGGIGKDKTDNFIVVSNLEHKSINFLDSTFTRTTASQFNPLSTIIKFNRNHVIRHIELGDSTSAGAIDFNNIDNGFTIAGGGVW